MPPLDPSKLPSNDRSSYFPISTKPGIRRDGTGLEANFWTDGVWSRFNRFGKPTKMGGYALITDQLPYKARGISVNPRSGYNDVHVGHTNGISYISLSPTASVAGPVINRTPATYAVDSNVIWQFEQIFDSFGAGTPRILAMPTSIGAAIDSQTNVNLFYGDVTNPGAILTDTTAPVHSGGVVVLHPYTFVYGNDGRVTWSDAQLPGSWPVANTNRIAALKIVKGLPMRGGASNSPAGLFWSLDSLVRCTLNPTPPPTFRFDTIGQDISVMSSNSVVEMDGIFYWLGEDRFYYYNGVVRELPNMMNLKTLMRRRTYSARMRTWAYSHPAENELHFIVPVDGSMDPNWDFCYNVGLQTWYDTPMPDSGRGAGFPTHVFPYPVMTGVDADVNGNYKLWQHEIGYDRIEGAQALAIYQKMVSSDVSYMTEGPLHVFWSGRNVGVRLLRFEPDFNQTGPMTVSTISRAFARSVPIIKGVTIQPTDVLADDLRGQGRQMRFMFESDTLGGYFEMGQPMILITEGDVRPSGI